MKLLAVLVTTLTAGAAFAVPVASWDSASKMMAVLQDGNLHDNVLKYHRAITQIRWLTLDQYELRAGSCTVVSKVSLKHNPDGSDTPGGPFYKAEVVWTHGCS